MSLLGLAGVQLVKSVTNVMAYNHVYQKIKNKMRVEDQNYSPKKNSIIFFIKKIR